MVNEQETRPSVVELAWLAGFVDGEGSFGLNKMDVAGKRFRLTAYFSLSNTDPRLVLYSVRLMDRLGLSPYVRDGNNQRINPKWSQSWDIRMNQHEKIELLLRALLPYLVGKKARAELLLRYIDTRRQKGTGRGHTYDQEDAQFYRDLKALNRRGSSETTRDASLLKDEDIVHSVGKPTG